MEEEVVLNSEISYGSDIYVVMGHVFDNGEPAQWQHIFYYTSSNAWRDYVETNAQGWFQCLLELNKWYTLYLEDCFDIKIMTPVSVGLAVLDPDTLNVRDIYNWLYDSTTAKGIMT